MPAAGFCRYAAPMLFLIVSACMWSKDAQALVPDKDAAVQVEGDDRVIRHGTRFDEAIKAVRDAAKSGDWRKPAWKDPAIALMLEGLIDQTRQATGEKELKVPVDFADVKPLEGNQVQRITGALIVAAGDFSGASASKSIILVDGNAKIPFADHCVIIARGAVYVAHGSANTIVAGHYITVSHDGNIRPGDAPSRSLLFSGGVLDIAHAKRTICSAPDLVAISHANGVTFLNSPNVKAGQGREVPNQSIDNAKLLSAPAPLANPLLGKLKVTQVVKGNDAGRGTMAVLDHAGVEIVARPAAPIKDGAGKVLDGLDGWTLSFVADDFALFTNGTQDAAFHIKPQ